MNKEQQELLDDAYENYEKHNDGIFGRSDHWTITKEEFIRRTLTNPDFARQWGVIIYTVVEDGNIRLGVNYNGKTIESYE